jgi:hypothetical protein
MQVSDNLYFHIADTPEEVCPKRMFGFLYTDFRKNRGRATEYGLNDDIRLFFCPSKDEADSRRERSPSHNLSLFLVGGRFYFSN